MLLSLEEKNYISFTNVVSFLAMVWYVYSLTP